MGIVYHGNGNVENHVFLPVVKFYLDPDNNKKTHSLSYEIQEPPRLTSLYDNTKYPHFFIAHSERNIVRW